MNRQRRATSLREPNLALNVLNGRHLFYLYKVLIRLLLVIVSTLTVDDRGHAVHSLVTESSVGRPCVPTQLVDPLPGGVASEPERKTRHRSE